MGANHELILNCVGCFDLEFLFKREIYVHFGAIEIGILKTQETLAWALLKIGD